MEIDPRSGDCLIHPPDPYGAPATALRQEMERPEVMELLSVGDVRAADRLVGEPLKSLLMELEQGTIVTSKTASFRDEYGREHLGMTEVNATLTYRSDTGFNSTTDWSLYFHDESKTFRWLRTHRTWSLDRKQPERSKP